jgi:pyrroloquinoline quinone biosynthesis protein B
MIACGDMSFLSHSLTLRRNAGGSSKRRPTSWLKLDKDIVAEVKRVDVAFLDATFFSADELPGRNINEVPHPLVTETMMLFENEDVKTRNKIVFIHMNHTNPLLWDDEKRIGVHKAGYAVGFHGMKR